MFDEYLDNEAEFREKRCIVLKPCGWRVEWHTNENFRSLVQKLDRFGRNGGPYPADPIDEIFTASKEFLNRLDLLVLDSILDGESEYSIDSSGRTESDIEISDSFPRVVFC